MAILRHIDPTLIPPSGVDGIFSPKFMTSFWLLVCFGVIGITHITVCCISYRSSKEVHSCMILSTVVIGVLILGMCTWRAPWDTRLLHGPNVPDLVVSTLIVQLLPLLAGIFLSVPLAAIMSTINAQSL